eukprot:8079520-Alexandrium_andersonii.AAC.1
MDASPGRPSLRAGNADGPVIEEVVQGSPGSCDGRLDPDYDIDSDGNWAPRARSPIDGDAHSQEEAPPTVHLAGH